MTASTLTPEAAALRAEAHPFIAEVDRHMLEMIDRHSGTVADVAALSVRAGGKRLRPLLVVAATPQHVRPGADAVCVAAAAEMVHTASMLHDDILDQASTRRGTPTVFSTHGELIAQAAGDLLFSLAFSTLVELVERPQPPTPTLAPVGALAAAARALAEGEALQADQHRDADLSIEQYLLRCEKKTGVLFGTTMAMAAGIAAAPPAHVELLNSFGTTIGVAFQIVDDILDCTASVEVLGKEPGSDLRAGTVTLPLLLAARSEPAVREALGNESGVDVREVLEFVERSGAAAEAQLHAEQLVHAALQILPQLQGDFDLQALTRVATSAVARLS